MSHVAAPAAVRRRTIDDQLADARTGLERLTPAQAFVAAQRDRGLIVDIRPQHYRDSEGSIPGAVILERNVLEWRLDPACDARLDFAGYDLHVMIICNEGYASSLAAASLQELGIGAATDVIGGYREWRAAGLPTTSNGQDAPAPGPAR